ncbi:MAG TPA: tetratricopeptide repeat protein, partial [Gemmataceae bacterium]|nr:tetratricopeptide repeat protein [Gemmataceae bacterium]
MDTINLALQYHQAGQLRQAEQLYLDILQAEPRHADALHFLGLCQYQTGRLEQAGESMRQSLDLKPGAVGFRCNLGLVYQALGKTQEAIATYEEVLRLDPQSAEAHGVLCNLLRPLGQLENAVAHGREAVRLQPDFAGAHNNLALAYREQYKLDEAVAHYREAIRIDPGYAAAHRNLGQALAAQDNLAEAEIHCRMALQFNPHFPEAHNSLGNILQSLGKVAEAVTHIRQALLLKPDFAEAHNNLGNALLRLEKRDEAEAHYLEAQRLRPEYDEVFNNLGALMLSTDRIDEGLANFEQALRLNPDYVEAHWNRSLGWLLHGDFERGWTEYEWRWQRPDFKWRNLPQPLWDGSNFAGKTLLIQTEQGLGDTIHFIRYAPLVKARGGTVIVQCQLALLKLLGGMEGVDQLAPLGSPLPPFDLQVQLLSLPRIFHTSEDNIPRAVPYLHADSALVEKWRECRVGGVFETHQIAKVGSEYSTHPTARHPPLLIGIAWQGNPTQSTDRRRSMPLRCFAPLAKLPGIQLVSLQKGFGVEQIQAVANDFSVVDLGSQLDETSGAFMDTAAIMKNLDLVISSDTAVPHLAG